MPLNMREPGGGMPPAYTHPISRSLAVAVLIAVVALFALRHLFGNVRLEAGTR